MFVCFLDIAEFSASMVSVDLLTEWKMMRYNLSALMREMMSVFYDCNTSADAV